MFKLVVLSAVLALAAAKPHVVAGPLAYSSVVAAPSAVSHQSRVDVVSSPVVSAYSAPVISAYSAPLVSNYAAAPVVSAYSSPLVSSYAANAPFFSNYAAAPVVSSYAAPLALAPNTPAVVLKATGVPLDTAEVINAKALHYQAKALNAHGIYKRSAVYPLAYNTVVAAPSAVSHQSRVDVVSSPVVSAYSAPVVSTYSAAPVVSTYAAAPVVSAYNTPVLSAYNTPVVSAYSAPLVSSYAAAPVVAGELALAPNTPAVVLKATGVPLDTAEVINAKNLHYQAKALNAHGIHKRSAVYPVSYTSVVAPSAVSHQSRVDIRSSPVFAAYSAPVVAAYSAAPVVSAYSSPVVSAYNTPLAYSTPVVSAYSVPKLTAAYGVHPY